MNNHIEDAQNNINKMFQLQTLRHNHKKKLQTIYKERQDIRSKAQYQHLKRIKQIQFHHKNKRANSFFKNVQHSFKIDYQNLILFNKLASLTFSKNQHNRSLYMFNHHQNKKSLDKDKCQLNPYKKKQHSQINSTNSRLLQKLNKVKSQVTQKLNLKSHVKNINSLKKMIGKKSPQKRAYIQSLVKLKGNQKDYNISYRLVFNQSPQQQGKPRIQTPIQYI